jgi:hypothetical protein
MNYLSQCALAGIDIDHAGFVAGGSEDSDATKTGDEELAAARRELNEAAQAAADDYRLGHHSSRVKSRHETA